MEIINVGDMLYHTKANVFSVGLPVGRMGAAGVNRSKYAPNPMGASKISTAAFLFDIFLATSMSVYQNDADKKVYVEWGGSGFTVCRNNIELIGSDTEDFISKNRHMLAVPCVIWQMIYGDNNNEMNALYKLIALGKDIQSCTYIFCDSFYYTYAMNYKTVTVFTAPVETIEAAMRSGYYKMNESLKEDRPSSFVQSMYDTSAPKTKKTTKKKKKDFLAECKEGKYRVNYEWCEEMQKYIIDASYLDTFESTEIFEEVVKKIKFHSDKIVERMDMGFEGAEAIGPDVLNIMMIGKPGTGKTTLAYALSAATGMPVCSTVWNKHSDEDEVEGKTKIIDGKPSFVETNALIFHLNGGINVNEEINLADPSVTMGSLGQQLEYPFIIKKNGYETRVRHPLNIQIATMNVGTNGSNPLNQALLNRFKTVFILDDPTKETFINILVKASKKEKPVCEWIYSVYEAVVNYLTNEAVGEDEIAQSLSIRTCLGALSNMDEGQSPKRAILNSIVGVIAATDLKVAETVKKSVIDILPNPAFDME